MSDVYCALTGAIPDEADLPIDHPLEDEELGDLPVGWTRVTVQTRVANPEWETILTVEEAMVRQILEGVPKAQRKAAAVGVRVQVAAQLAALKAQTAPYNIQTDTYHVAASDEGTAGLAKLRELLGESEEGAENAQPKGTGAEADEAEESEA